MMILYYYTIDDDYALYVCIILLFMSEKLNIVGTNSTLLISSLNISALPLYYVAITVWDLTHTDTFSHAYRLCLHVPLYSTTSSVYIHVYITSSTVYTSNVLAFSDTQPIFFFPLHAPFKHIQPRPSCRPSFSCISCFFFQQTKMFWYRQRATGKKTSII